MLYLASKDSLLPTRTSLRFPMIPFFSNWTPWRSWTSVIIFWTTLLGGLEKLSTLILDCNNYNAHVKFPYMPSLTTLWINKNKISNLPIIVEEISCKFPNIKFISMMNNEAAPSYFNGGSLTQYMDYRQYVISQIPSLEVLDDTEVQEKERALARKTYRMQRIREGSRKRKELHR
ncbi:leucine-rich melanocyte differentiation-associated protein isoform X2 [Paramisgurnus dabryanus]|uniref:leucine-rich melanocyte differentiation-associated protein isoform X2 n=1 Tax=Paramisgurnus dabryanus TaxID=90735 RepID=UPI0031F3D06A